jgi:sporulation-control protein spo0M
VGLTDAEVDRIKQEFMPGSNVKVMVLVPEGRQVKSIEFVRVERSVSFVTNVGEAVVALPAAHIAEVVHLQFAKLLRCSVTTFLSKGHRFASARRAWIDGNC